MVMNISSSKERFVTAAINHGRFTVSGNSDACNEAYDEIIIAARELKELPDNGATILVDLLNYSDDSVKAWAAAYLLPLYPAEAMKVLEEIASRPGLIAFSAGMTLREWRAGRLELP